MYHLLWLDELVLPQYFSYYPYQTLTEDDVRLSHLQHFYSWPSGLSRSMSLCLLILLVWMMPLAVLLLLQRLWVPVAQDVPAGGVSGRGASRTRLQGGLGLPMQPLCCGNPHLPLQLWNCPTHHCQSTYMFTHLGTDED